MTARIWLLLLLALMVTGLVLVSARGTPSADRTVIQELLEMRSPARSDNRTNESADTVRDPLDMPPTLKSPEELLGYWGQERRPRGAGPSDKIRELILKATERYPDKLAGVLDHLPPGSETHAVVKRIYEESRTASWFDEYWEKDVRTWLMLNSRYFRDDHAGPRLRR
jgi:hypothetical protein